MAINNTVTYDQALNNLKKGGLTGNTFNMAKSNLDSVYKTAPAPVPTPTSMPVTTTSATKGDPKVKGLLTPKSSLNFSGLVGNLASASKPNDTQTGLIKKNTQAAEGNTAIGQQARGIAQTYAPEIARVGQLGAAAGAGYGSTGSNIVGSGNAAIASNNASQRMSALTQAEQAELAGNAQQLTAQSQLQSGYNNALAGANTQQSQQLSGLNNAAGLAQPQVAAFGQTAFNPLTGTYDGSGGLPDAVLAQYAQMAANGQYSAIPSTITANPVLSAQLNAAASAINPAYNPIASTAQGNVQSSNIQSLGTAQTAGQAAGIQAQAAAPGQAAASNIQTAGTTPTTAASAGYQQALTEYNDANTAFSQAKSQGELLKGAISGVNGIGARYGNVAVNALANQFGSADYTAFVTTLAEAQQAYTNLLASVGASTPTVNGRQADEILSPSSTPAQIDAAIKALDAAAMAKLNPLYQKVNTYQQNLNSGNATENAKVGNYSYQLVNGKWVLAQ